MLKSGRTDEKPRGHKFGVFYQADTDDAPREAVITEAPPADPPKWLDGDTMGWIETRAAIGQIVNLEDGTIRDDTPEEAPDGDE